MFGTAILTRFHRYWLVGVFTLMPVSLFAQEVEAGLSSDTTSVGEPVELRITATGESPARLIDELAVDGLIVASNSSSTQMQMSFPNFRREVISTWRMVIVPTREGRFSIPPLRVQVDGKTFKTLPSVLSVTGGSGGSVGGIPVRPAIPVPPSGGGTQRSVPTAPPVPAPPTISPPQSMPTPSPFVPQSTMERWFGELVVPKEEAFVGEVIPVDLRFCVDGNLPAQFADRPAFSGEGFTVYRTSQPTEVTRDIQGQPYSCIIYRSAITAAKAGELEIPPATVAARVQLPVQPPRGMDPFFGQMFQQFGMSDVQEIEIATEPARIDVKPLPLDGQPESFRGAIGEFEMETSVSPPTAESGEPVTLKVEISGRGNFEAMGPPVLADDRGWRVYDPTSDFQASPSDPIGFHGRKTYEFTLLAREDRNATPEVLFSYFDPVDEKYVTLTGAPAAVKAAGSGQAPTPAAVTASPGPSPEAGPADQPSAPTGSDELSKSFQPANFQPVGWSQAFLIPGLILLLLWLLVLGTILFIRHRESPHVRRAAGLRLLRKNLKSLGDPVLSDADFLAGVSSFVVSRLDGRRLEDTNLPEEAHEVIAKALHRADEIKFSRGGSHSIDADERSRILAQLRQLDEALF